jgi:hypothetical protein
MVLIFSFSFFFFFFFFFGGGGGGGGVAALPPFFFLSCSWTSLFSRDSLLSFSVALSLRLIK